MHPLHECHPQKQTAQLMHTTPHKYCNYTSESCICKGSEVLVYGIGSKKQGGGRGGGVRRICACFRREG